MNLSKKQIQWVRSLAIRKNRDREQAFIAEGPKVVGELIDAGFECLFLAYTEEAANELSPHGPLFTLHSSLFTSIVTAQDLSRLSQLQTPQGVIAVFRIPPEPSLTLGTPPAWGEMEGGFFSLLLDRVQDPGNVGTIIRLCDWFGVEDIFLSEGCADPWAPKVVQASMGALARVRVHTHVDAANLCKTVRTQGLPIYACVLDGENIFQADLNPTSNEIRPSGPPFTIRHSPFTKKAVRHSSFFIGSADTAPARKSQVNSPLHSLNRSVPHSSFPLVVLGNEGQGISQEVLDQVSRRLTIPNYPPGRPTSESLNVAMAAAIVLAEFRRRL